MKRLLYILEKSGASIYIDNAKTARLLVAYLAPIDLYESKYPSVLDNYQIPNIVRSYQIQTLARIIHDHMLGTRAKVDLSLIDKIERSILIVTYKEIIPELY